MAGMPENRGILPKSYTLARQFGGVGRGRGFGRGLGVGVDLGVGVGVGVGIASGAAKAYTLLSPAT